VVLADVNVLVYAHREDALHHAGCRQWVEAVVNGDESFGLSDLVLSGFLRVVTHPKVFAVPTPLADALEFAEQFAHAPTAWPWRQAPGTGASSGGFASMPAQ
jgi:uncharacterized protein